MNVHKVTTKGLEKLKKEYKYLVSVKVREVAEKMKNAAEYGDLPENSAWDSAVEEKALLDAQINEIEETIKNHVVLKTKSRRDKTKIEVYTKFIVILNGQRKELIIVGEGEGDILNNQIQIDSPIAERLIGKSIGDEIKFVIGKDVINCTIVEIL